MLFSTPSWPRSIWGGSGCREEEREGGREGGRKEGGKEGGKEWEREGGRERERGPWLQQPPLSCGPHVYTFVCCCLPTNVLRGFTGWVLAVGQ